MKEYIKDWVGRKKKYRHKLRQNIMRLKLPANSMEAMGHSRTYWSDIIKMDVEECKRELQEVESDIEYLEAGGWDNLDDDEDNSSGRKETRKS